MRYKKGIALEMRQRGFSYSEIEQRLGIPKSTLNFWLKEIKLTPEQNEKLRKRQIEALKKSSSRRKEKFEQSIVTIQNLSSKEIAKISQRELWLMGVMLYWRERLGDDLSRGVRFSSTDPTLLKLFLKWLREIGQITEDEIAFDIFVHRKSGQLIAKKKRLKNSNLESTIQSLPVFQEAIKYWARELDVPKDQFIHMYGQSRRSEKSGSGERRKNTSRAPHGFVRIRVKASSLLARQISGWIKGITQQLL